MRYSSSWHWSAGSVWPSVNAANAARTRRTQRELYLDYLETFRARMRDRARETREQATNLEPEPAALTELIRDPGRLWERRRSHPDFLRVRIGLGDRPWFSLSVPPEENPVTPYDPIMLAEAEAVAQHYSVVLGLPVTTDLDGAGQVAVIGGRADVLAVARSMLLQLAALHSPDDLLLAAAFPAEPADDWRGFDLLPHAVGRQALRRTRAGAPGGDLDRGPATGARRRAGRPGPGRRHRQAQPRADRGHSGRAAGRVLRRLRPAGLDAAGTRRRPRVCADLQITTVHLLSDRLHEPSDVTVRVTLRDGHATVTDTRPVRR